MTSNERFLTDKHQKWSNPILYKIYQQFNQSSWKQNEEDSPSSKGDTSSTDETGEES